MRRGPAHNRKAGRRQPNGALSQAEKEVQGRRATAWDQAEIETLVVGLSARERVFGVDPAWLRDQRTGSFVGRLSLSKRISARQYEAAQLWARSAISYSIARCSPRQPHAVQMEANIRGQANGENLEANRQAVERHEAAIEAVRDAERVHLMKGELFRALTQIVEQDRERNLWAGDLRLALNALAHHYGL